MEIIFGLNLVSKHCSELPKFAKKKNYFQATSLSLSVSNLTSLICEHIYLFQYSVIYYKFTSDWNLSFKRHCLEFRLHSCFAVSF